MRNKEKTEGLIIESVTEEGRRFRPSDWIERISSVLGTFGPDRRLHYSPHVFPLTIEGEKCLFVSGELAKANPAALEYVMRFVRENKLRIREDRRDQPSPSIQKRSA